MRRKTKKLIVLKIRFVLRKLHHFYFEYIKYHKDTHNHYLAFMMRKRNNHIYLNKIYDQFHK